MVSVQASPSLATQFCSMASTWTGWFARRDGTRSARVGRHVGEAGLFGQETGQFDVRVFALFHLAVELQEKLVVVDERRVALLDAEYAAGSIRLQGFERAARGPGGDARQFALRAVAETFASGDERQQGTLESLRPRWRRKARRRRAAWQ